MWKSKNAAHYSANVKEDGYTVLKEFISIESIDRMAACFRPILEKRITMGPPDRGPGRYYTTIPFTLPFAC